MKLLPPASTAALLLATTTTTTAYVLPSSSPNSDLIPRYVSGLVAPSSYTYSWAIDGYRLALNTTGAPSYLTRYTVSKDATSTTQQHVDSCTAFCEKTAGCAMASVIKFLNFDEGTVICAVYGTVLPKTEAKYTTGLFNGKGEVKASYSFARNAGAVKGAVTSSTVRSATTSSSAIAAQSSTKSSSTISSPSTASTRGTSTTASTTTSTQSTTTTSSASTSTSSSSASTSTSSASTSTSPAPAPSSTPIYDQWQWIDVPGTSCADGTATGFALSLHANSTELVLSLQQGGSCYDYQTCYVDKRAYNVGGSTSPAFNNATFYSQNQPSSLKGWFPFARGNQYNPWANSNYAWIPYCTGDFHAGDNVVDYNGRTTYHKGWGNVKLDVGKVKEMVPGVKRVWLIGSSAGGFGSILQYQNVQDTFGVRVDLLVDSAETPFSILRHPSQNIQPPNKARCPNCNDTNFDSYIVGLAQANPTARFGSTSWSNDSTIPANQGVSSQDFATEVERLFTEEDETTTNARNYMVEGSGHILLYTTQYSAKDGYTMANWLNKFKTDDAGWSSH
ncbi:hypothetical protein PHSY_001893 [Pseudozyma hubeiensis SY62]|uniref:Uncharacterized protein n=1 Tax=Pseudozyma hubeiensis (strain SY62) TaxID=1305764 RepID=R9P022_PSEHS|nr:hypothetical protein PHSY_001893 [Pseudozyma hubeiensis SY62]GAC94322.1 hypothetical protein PHSY_001893 [Pseudozyma hubeiensis SY62]